MASKEIVVYLTSGIKDFFVRKGGEKTADCISKHFRFIHTQPFLNLNMFEKAHLVFRSQMIILVDTMIVNRLKHRVLGRSCFIYQYFPCYNNQWKY